MDRSICYQEECAPGGCFMELAVQMVFIFVGKQFLMQFVEYAVPLLRKGRTQAQGALFCSFLPAWLLHSWFCATENYILIPKHDAPSSCSRPGQDEAGQAGRGGERPAARGQPAAARAGTDLQAMFDRSCSNAASF